MNKRIENKTMMYQYDKELASAFQVDCEDFLNDFEKFQSFSFTDFQGVWQDRSFSFIYAGQSYALLLRDFCDNCFWVVKKYIMFPRSMFTQIGAFYLLYGLYYRQPLRGWVKIRLTLEEYHKIYELVLEMKNRNQMDAVYIFSKMRTEEAFLYVAERRPLGPEDRFVKGVEVFINDTFTAAKTQSSLVKFQELPKSDVFSSLGKTNTEYSELLKKFSETHPSIPPFTSKLMDTIQKAYDDFNIEVPIAQTQEESPQELASIKDRRNAVRAKAMANKNAVYRANRKMKTALNAVKGKSPEYDQDSFDSSGNCEPSTSHCEPSTSTQSPQAVDNGKIKIKKKSRPRKPRKAKNKSKIKPPPDHSENSDG